MPRGRPSAIGGGAWRVRHILLFGRPRPGSADRLSVISCSRGSTEPPRAPDRHRDVELRFLHRPHRTGALFLSAEAFVASIAAGGVGTGAHVAQRKPPDPRGRIYELQMTPAKLLGNSPLRVTIPQAAGARVPKGTSVLRRSIQAAGNGRGWAPSCMVPVCDVTDRV